MNTATWTDLQKQYCDVLDRALLLLRRGELDCAEIELCRATRLRATLIARECSMLDAMEFDLTQ